MKPRTWSTTVVLIVVFGVFLVSQLVVLAVLSAEATAAPTVTQNCQVNFWVLHLECSEVSTTNPNAFEAQTLTQYLLPAFLVFDAVFLVVVAIVAISSGSRSGAGSGRQIGGSGR